MSSAATTPAQDTNALDRGKGLAADGVWKGYPPPWHHEAHVAVYDPLRDRMVVFGGVDGVTLNEVWVLPLGAALDWTKLAASGTPPSPRSDLAAIYDPVRDRMIVFGGRNGSTNFNEAWALSLGPNPAWMKLLPTGSAPSGLFGHAAIYDPIRDRMLVFGGYDGNYSNRTWALSLDANPAWMLLPVVGPLPNPRSRASAIYDPLRDRMIVFAGVDGISGDPSNDVWQLSLAGTPAWSQLAPSGIAPSVRHRHTAIYDPVRDRMVVFGGAQYSSAGLSDTWELSLSGSPQWLSLQPSGSLPSGRSKHTSIYDPVRDRMLVYGGFISYGVELWALSLGPSPAWTQYIPGPAIPGPRAFHTAVHDPVRDRMIVFGGEDGSTELNQSWVLSLGAAPTWSQLLPGGTAPAGRDNHTAIYDPVLDRMIIFAGSTAGPVNDLWVLSLGGTPQWTQVTPSGVLPLARYGHTVIFDPVRDRMIVFGGINGLQRLNDVWTLSLGANPTWTQLTPSGAPPAGRYVARAVYDPLRDRMIVFGGRGPGALNDVWSLSFAPNLTWTQLSPSGAAPAPRALHSLVYEPIRDRIILFGGYGTSWLNDSWSLSLGGTPAWSALAPLMGPPPPRDGHSMIYDPARNEMILFAGEDAPGWRADTWALDFGSPPTAVSGLASLEAIPAKDRIEIRWTVRSREEYLGFDVLRSDEGGPYERMTSVTIANAAEVYPATFSWMDEAARPEREYAYRVEVVHPDATTEVWGQTVTARLIDRAAGAFALRVSGPSPFLAREGTAIEYDVPRPGATVSIRIYDSQGRRVAELFDGRAEPGAHTARWSGPSLENLATGVYFVRMQSGVFHTSERLVLLR